jgi:hypothetical protein
MAPRLIWLCDPSMHVQELVQVESLSQVGVQLLLFTLGLEFSLSKLRAVRSVALLGAPLRLLQNWQPAAPYVRQLHATAACSFSSCWMLPCMQDPACVRASWMLHSSGSAFCETADWLWSLECPVCAV